MKRTVLYIVLILAIPALCHGSIGLGTRLEHPLSETAVWNAYNLKLEHVWMADLDDISHLDLHLASGAKIIDIGSLEEIHGGIPLISRPAPKDMVSMMSFIWAEMFGGVDIVAEVKDFARQVRRRGQPVKVHDSEKRESPNRWKFVLACRVDKQTEVAASLGAHGQLFREGNMVLEVNTLDPRTEEVGLTMSFSGGDLNLRADRMTLTETAEAKLVVKF